MTLREFGESLSIWIQLMKTPGVFSIACFSGVIFSPASYCSVNLPGRCQWYWERPEVLIVYKPAAPIEWFTVPMALAEAAVTDGCGTTI